MASFVAVTFQTVVTFGPSSPYVRPSLEWVQFSRRSSLRKTAGPYQVLPPPARIAPVPRSIERSWSGQPSQSGPRTFQSRRCPSPSRRNAPLRVPTRSATRSVIGLTLPHPVSWLGGSDPSDHRRDPHRTRARRAARSRRASRPHGLGLQPRGRRSGRPRPTIPALSPGRPRLRSDAALEPTLGMAEAGARRLPGLAPRPARYRSIDTGRTPDPGRDARGAGHVSHALPSRFHRPGRRAHPARARQRAMERPRPVVRWLYVDDLPVDRARRASRSGHHGLALADR